MNVFTRIHWNYLDLLDARREKFADEYYKSVINGLMDRGRGTEWLRVPYAAWQLLILREFIRDNDMFHDDYLLKRTGKKELFPAERFDAGSRRLATCSELETLERRARSENMPITYGAVQTALSYLHRDPPEDYRRWTENSDDGANDVIEDL